MAPVAAKRHFNWVLIAVSVIFALLTAALMITAQYSRDSPVLNIHYGVKNLDLSPVGAETHLYAGGWNRVIHFERNFAGISGSYSDIVGDKCKNIESTLSLSNVLFSSPEELSLQLNNYSTSDDEPEYVITVCVFEAFSSASMRIISYAAVLCTLAVGLALLPSRGYTIITAVASFLHAIVFSFFYLYLIAIGVLITGYIQQETHVAPANNNGTTYIPTLGAPMQHLMKLFWLFPFVISIAICVSPAAPKETTQPLIQYAIMPHQQPYQLNQPLVYQDQAYQQPHTVPTQQQPQQPYYPPAAPPAVAHYSTPDAPPAAEGTYPNLA